MNLIKLFCVMLLIGACTTKTSNALWTPSESEKALMAKEDAREKAIKSIVDNYKDRKSVV